jgi:hypothetical protein
MATTSSRRPEGDVPAGGPCDSPVPGVTPAPRTGPAVSGRVDPRETHVVSRNDCTGYATLGLTLRKGEMERGPTHHLRFQSTRDGAESSISPGRGVSQARVAAEDPRPGVDSEL